ncbi:MAG: ribosome-associated ATPase/putative transporter RbbA [Cardiobacteriaceae bacterium]|nr:ribosome-associated ATPase/putative transporter RbbA [Cardiobacteriaceae bacterium]
MNSAITIEHLSHRYGKILALDDISLTLPQGTTVGLIGPDGVGKSTLLSLIAGVRSIQKGRITVFNNDLSQVQSRLALSHRIAYMPQGLGRNLYPTLSVYENIDFHARLFGLNSQERRNRISRLLEATGLAPFPDRAAGKLSGGMKQKVSLCCALVHTPELLILDEPTTGVDPLSRRQFWSLVSDLQQEAGGMTVLVATAYIEEAEQFQQIIAMDAGKLLTNTPTQELMQTHGYSTLEETYIHLLPAEKQQGAGGLELTPFTPIPNAPPAMEAHDLTKQFGTFTAVNHVSFRIEKGEIFGFLGSNGCGKSTTMKMLTGLLKASSGTAELLGAPIDAGSVSTRMRVGYMSQAFSLYEELTVRQNLELHARLYHLAGKGKKAIADALQQFELASVADSKPAALPLGIRQRLQLAAACLHHPEILILDEPTSGVDPAARDMFWRYLLRMSHEDKITIFVSTHFMNEAARCDRISFMHQGRVLAVGTPDELIAQYHAPNLEEAFVQYLLQDEKAQAQHGKNTDNITVDSQTITEVATDSIPVSADSEHTANTQNAINTTAEVIPASVDNEQTLNTAHDTQSAINTTTAGIPASTDSEQAVNAARDTQSSTAKTASSTVQHHWLYWFSTIYTFAIREGKELLRDQVRTFFAVFGPVILMTAVTWGVSFDVGRLNFAVLDHDKSPESQSIIEYFSGSAYFAALPEPQNEQEATSILASGVAKLVIDIPPDFGRDLLRGDRPEIGFFIDGTESFNASNINAYIGSILSDYARDEAARRGIAFPAPIASMESRFIYNQDFKSIYAIAPGVLMLALTLFPAMMAAVGVVREREIGSIANFYSSPANRLQFLLGKQIPYILASMVSFLILFLMMRYWFGLPLKGSFLVLFIGTLLMSCTTTAMGLFASCFTRSQVAAIFLTAVATTMPAMSFSGFLVPVSSLQGGAYIMGKILPSSWYATLTTGTFTKGLHLADLQREILLLCVSYLFFLALAYLNLRKQEK